MSADPDLRPRDYAWQIMHLKTREARIEALNEVPAHWQAMVRTYVEMAYARYWTHRQEEKNT